MSNVFISGVGMTRFARQPGVGVRALATAAAQSALDDAGVVAGEIEKIYFANAVAGIISQQEMIRGQVAFRFEDLAGTPTINIENACASGSTALNLAWQAIASGQHERVLVVGAEQLTHTNKTRTFNALRGSTDIAEIGEADASEIAINSILMDFYAHEAATYLRDYDATPTDLALVAVKNRSNGSRNPLAQYRAPQTVEEVLAGRPIVSPLTLAMCSPVTDGAAALVLSSRPRVDDVGQRRRVRIMSSDIAGGTGAGSSPVRAATQRVYEAAGVGPDDLDVVELHDAAAPAELIQYAEIGLCEDGEGHHLLRRGVTALGGRIPVNTSGGLLSREHPLGATGCAQLVELSLQLRGEAAGRQVDGARTAMAVNGGGWLGGQYAVAVTTVLQQGG